MADVRWEINLKQTDGTDFSSANETGAAVRLRNSTVAGANSSEYIGNVAGSGDFTETGKGLWYINIDSGDSGYFLVQTYTTASGAWSDTDGFAPIYVPLEDFLPLTGGTMSGAIVMGDNSITGIDTLTFTDTVGTVAGIQNGNLLDKALNGEEVSGNWTLSGDNTISGANTFSGVNSFETDKLKINSIIVSPYHFISRTWSIAGMDKADVNGAFFTVDGSYEVAGITCVFTTAEATAATCYLQIERLSAGEAPGTGDDILTNETNNGFSLKGAPDTVLTGTLTNTVLSAGYRLGFILSADSTELAGLNITVKLKAV